MKQLFNEQAISRTLVRIAHEILEKNKGCDDLVLLQSLPNALLVASKTSKASRFPVGVWM